MRILVLGASGFVGAALLDRLAAARVDVTGTYRRSALPPRSSRRSPRGVMAHPPASMRALDLTHTEELMDLVDEVAPDAVVSLAAESDVRAAESPAARSEAEASLRSLGALAAECKRAERHVTLLSSDYVFDGSAGPYSEDDEPSPAGEYGRHKLASEESVLSSGAAALVIRTSMVYGWPRPAQHGNFAVNVIRSLRSDETVTAHEDVLRTPIYVGDLVDCVAELVLAHRTGLYHAGSSDAVSMFDFALRVCESFDLDKARVTAAKAAGTEPARPLRSGLKTEKITGELRRPLAATDEGLRRMKEEEPTDA